MRKLLAQCRDAFPVPDPDSPLEASWVSAFHSPEHIPRYVEKCVEDFNRQLEAREAALRVLSSKIQELQERFNDPKRS